MRRFLIAGNWKMNCGPKAAQQLVGGLRNKLPNLPEKIDVLVCPPFVSLTTAAEKLDGYEGAYMGAQNMYFEDNGAYTGEISTRMLNEVGCSYVIIGHSERREYFAESDKTVNIKVTKSLSDGLTPVICVGESLDQRKSGVHVGLVEKQVEMALNGVEPGQATEVVVAYEPIWAIGTGETATPEQAQEMHKMIRAKLENLFDDKTAGQIRVLYGGSMKPHNAEELLSQPDVDGGLIGGASLKADSFSEIIQIAEKLS